MVRMEFRKILKEKRKELGLTQEQLAKDLNVSRSAISNWEIGRNYPDIETLITISNVFNIPLDYLLNEDIRVVEAIDLDISKSKKFKRATYILISLLMPTLFFLSFLLLSKTPNINLVEEVVPYNSEIIPLEKNEFKDFYIKDNKLEIIFDNPQQDAGYYIDRLDDELNVSIYKLSEPGTLKKEDIKHYKSLLSIDLSEYDQIKLIKINYGETSSLD